MVYKLLRLESEMCTDEGGFGMTRSRGEKQVFDNDKKYKRVWCKARIRRFVQVSLLVIISNRFHCVMSTIQTIT